MFDFFAEQKKNKAITIYLVIWFVIGTLATATLLSLTSYMLFPISLILDEAIIEGFFDAFPVHFTLFKVRFNNLIFSMVVLGVAFILFLVNYFDNYELIKKGGEVIIKKIGGRFISTRTTDPKERQLINMAEELSIASGLPIPYIYVFKEPGINAFAISENKEKAAIVFSEGAIKHLNRDELQGVMAHEFSHIIHGDMTLNLALILVVKGLRLFYFLGYTLLFDLYKLGKDDSRATQRLTLIQIALSGFSLSLLIIGKFSSVMANLIQALISQKREYLADAAATQYTRHHGLGNALIKIAQQGSLIKHSKVEELSHLFFAEATKQNLFSSHPPLADRIERLTGKVLTMKPQELSENYLQTEELSPINNLHDNGSINETIKARTDHNNQVNHGLIVAKEILELIPYSLKRSLQDSPMAEAMIYRSFLNESQKEQSKQLNSLQLYCSLEINQKVLSLLKMEETLHLIKRLPLLQLAIRTMKEEKEEIKERVLTNSKLLIKADQQVDFKELIFAEILFHSLKGSCFLANQKTPLPENNEAICYIMSILAIKGHDSLTSANEAYLKGRELILQEDHGAGNLFNWDQELFQSSLQKLEKLPDSEKEKLIKGCITIVKHDEEITARENEILQALSCCLGVPLPILTTTET